MAIVDILCELTFGLIRIYSDVLALSALLCIRLPYALITPPLRLFFPKLFKPRFKSFQSIFITGASVGLGAGLAKEFAGPNVQLFLTAKSLQGLDQTKRECEALGASVTCLEVDVRNAEQMQKEIQRAHAQRRLDLVIANAGISAQQDGLLETRLVLETNVLGMANTIVPALELMLGEKDLGPYSPQLVLMSSLGGLGASGSLFMAPYVASKSAIRVYGESLRHVLSNKHIGVTVILPGMTESRMVSQQIGAGIKMTTGVWTIQRATALMRRGICENEPEVAYPFAWYAIAKTFSGMPNFFKDWVAPLTRQNDPYHAMDKPRAS